MSKEAVKIVRNLRLLCEDCYVNLGGMSGQALTDWSCRICKGQHTSGSTATQDICKACALSHGLCEDCGTKKHLYQEEVQ